MNKIFVLLLMIGFATGLLAQGTVTDTVAGQGSPLKHTIVWVSNSNGVVNATNSLYSRGVILRAVLTGGSTGASYHVTLKDAAGIDVLGGRCATLATNTTTSFAPGIIITDTSTSTNLVPISVNDRLVVGVTDVGSNKTGTIVLYVR
jgi:hypothetical protein